MLAVGGGELTRVLSPPSPSPFTPFPGTVALRKDEAGATEGAGHCQREQELPLTTVAEVRDWPRENSTEHQNHLLQ